MARITQPTHSDKAVTKVEQMIEGQTPEQQASISTSEESARGTTVICDAPKQQQQNGDEEQAAPAPQANTVAGTGAANDAPSATRPTSLATTANNGANDPVESEPYRWHQCTVGINITLIPDPTDRAHYQTALIGIRTHNDAPIIRRVAAGELLPLPSCIIEMIREMREQLPARGEAREERVARAKQAAARTAKSPVTKTQPPKAKVKPGRYVAAAAGAPAANAVEQGSFDDDLFGTQPAAGEVTGAVGEEPEGTDDFASETQREAAGAKASEGAVKQSVSHRQNHTSQKVKYDKRGRALEKSSSTPQNQMSLI